MNITGLTGRAKVVGNKVIVDYPELKELMTENEKLQQLVEYLEAKINSALIAHPHATPILLQEALDRTHL